MGRSGMRIPQAQDWPWELSITTAVGCKNKTPMSGTSARTAFPPFAHAGLNTTITISAEPWLDQRALQARSSLLPKSASECAPSISMATLARL